MKEIVYDISYTFAQVGDRPGDEPAGRLTHLRPIIIVAIDVGLRRGELLSLEVEQVDFNLDVINAKRTKSGKGRTIPMTPRVRGALISLCEGGDGRYIFANSNTGVDPDLSSVKGTMNRDGTHSRVRRGGAFVEDGWTCRSACRLRYEPERRSYHIGFRVVAVQP